MLSREADIAVYNTTLQAQKSTPTQNEFCFLSSVCLVLAVMCYGQPLLTLGTFFFTGLFCFPSPSQALLGFVCATSNTKWVHSCNFKHSAMPSVLLAFQKRAWRSRIPWNISSFTLNNQILSLGLLWFSVESRMPFPSPECSGSHFSVRWLILCYLRGMVTVGNSVLSTQQPSLILSTTAFSPFLKGQRFSVPIHSFCLPLGWQNSNQTY